MSTKRMIPKMILGMLSNTMSRKLMKKYPGTWFTRYPFESNKPGSPKEKQESRMTNHEPDRKGHLPFPVFWMPYMPEEKGKEVPEEKNITNSKPCLEPVKEPEVKNVTNSKPCSEPVKDSGQQTGVHAIPTVKEIPVKEVRQHEESVISQIKEGRRDTSIKDVNNTGEKLAKEDSKRKPSSPPKTPKLPPVCLRVDPLPRRKDTKGKSRSPSPPRNKRKLDQLSNGVRKVVSSTNHEADQVTTKESKEGKGTTKAIKVVDGSTCQEEHSKRQIEMEHNKGKVSMDCSKSGQAVGPEDTLLSGGEEREISSDKEMVAHEVKEPRRPEMSEEQAAVIIQSAYRAFVIRRWEPVKKLKQIARVCEKMTEVNASIQAMESSSYIQGNDKQRTIIAETIMSLLLELDTIQGLHPSIREVRKSVVRQLVALQEKLDAMMNEKSKASEEQQLAAKCAVTASRKRDDISSQIINETQPELVMPCLLDGKTCEGSEISEQSAEEPKVISESFIVEDYRPAVESMLVDGEQVSQPEASIVAKEDNGVQVLGQDSECSLQDKSSNGRVDSLAIGVGTQCDLSELPREVSDDHCKHLEEEQVSQSEASVVRDDGQVLGQECSLQHNSSSEEKIDSLANGDEPQHEATELPKEVSDAQCPSGAGELEQANQPEGRLTEENSSEFNHDVPLGEIISSHVTETNRGHESMENKKLHDEFVTTDQVENATENVEFEPDKCFAQSSECTDMVESPEYLHPVIENPKGEEAYDDISQEGLSTMQKEDASKESPDTDAAADILEEEVKFVDDIVVSHQCSAEPTGDACSVVQIEEEKQPTEAEKRHSLLENEVNFAPEVDNTPEITSLAATGGQTVEMNPDYGQIRHVNAERDEKLMQENERLRDMVEKLVNSGQEQLRVISNLSGRVKDLEKNLSKRRRVKVKPHKGKRSSSLEEFTDGVTV